MKNLNTPLFEACRLVTHEVQFYGRRGDATAGMFSITSVVDKMPLNIIASAGEGWDHVSVSRGDRCPTWEEMEQVARVFFDEHEWAIQFHVPSTQHINIHGHCLHWWRPHSNTLPLPPKEFV